MKKKLYGIGLIGALLVSGALLGNKQEMLRTITENALSKLEFAADNPGLYEYEDVEKSAGDAIDKIDNLNVRNGQAAKKKIKKALAKFANKKGVLFVGEEGFEWKIEEREKEPEIEEVDWQEILKRKLPKEEKPKIEEYEFGEWVKDL